MSITFKNMTFEDKNVYLSTEVGEYTEWRWKKQNVPKPGQYLINEEGIKYDIIDVVIYTNEFTMIWDYGKRYGEKLSIDETKYDECFWNRLSDDVDCHIVFFVCCNKSK